MTSSPTLAITLLLITLAQAQAQTSEWVHPDPATGKLLYKTTPKGDRILDFSHAGYMGGGIAIPEVPTVKTLSPSGTEDDSTLIQKALDDLAQLPLDKNGHRGALLLSPGTYNCPKTITLSANGITLRGAGPDKTTLKLTTSPHVGIIARATADRAQPTGNSDTGNSARTNLSSASLAKTTLADPYVPSGTDSFKVTSTAGFSPGDTIQIRKPVTPEWIEFMQMHNLVRDGKPQTWIKAGSVLTTERRIASIDGNKITVDVPLADCFDAKYAGPEGTPVVKVPPPQRLTQVGLENFCIEAPPSTTNHSQPHYEAFKLTGEDCWARNIHCDETMNSVSTGGRRITLQNITVTREAKHEGASKPAEFAPNGSQVLLDRCNVTADNIWFVATGSGVSGPVVILNCTFTGQSRAESHQRWSTGLLYDNCSAPQGGLEFKNRGSMGSGHGWSMGWGVIWNCAAKDYVVQSPPGAMNWLIGSAGENKQLPRPFDKATETNLLPRGTEDSPGIPVTPKSLYLAQLQERLGPQALKNIGY